MISTSHSFYDICFSPFVAATRSSSFNGFQIASTAGALTCPHTGHEGGIPIASPCDQKMLFPKWHSINSLPPSFSNQAHKGHNWHAFVDQAQDYWARMPKLYSTWTNGSSRIAVGRYVMFYQQCQLTAIDDINDRVVHIRRECLSVSSAIDYIKHTGKVKNVLCRFRIIIAYLR